MDGVLNKIEPEPLTATVTTVRLEPEEGGKQQHHHHHQLPDSSAMGGRVQFGKTAFVRSGLFLFKASLAHLRPGENRKSPAPFDLSTPGESYK